MNMESIKDGSANSTTLINSPVFLNFIAKVNNQLFDSTESNLTELQAALKILTTVSIKTVNHQKQQKVLV